MSFKSYKMLELLCGVDDYCNASVPRLVTGCYIIDLLSDLSKGSCVPELTSPGQ